METFEGRTAIYAGSRATWREWLIKNHLSERTVWLILYHKKSEVKSIGYNEAMEEALCFGWIDSKAKKRDRESFYVTFTPRNPKSLWSIPNKERATRMMDLNNLLK